MGKGKATRSWQQNNYRGVCINRTPTTGLIATTRDNRDIDAFGCGLELLRMGYG
jgi:hypothetical protein